MKRLIKFWNVFQSDKATFSDSSSNYEVLAELVDDSAGIPELKALAKKHGIKLGRKTFTEETSSRGCLRVTHAINTTEIHKRPYFGRTEEHPVYLAFITFKHDGVLKPLVTIENKVTKQQANDIVNNQAYGVSDVGETVDGKVVLVRESWHYGHSIRFAGYSLGSFENQLGVEEMGFDDDTYRCSGCNLYDSADSGYTMNHRVVECELLGVNCGCFQEYSESDEAIENYTNNSAEAMGGDSAEKLADAGKLKHLERFIGGMTDGRGGFYGGKSTREGNPKSVLAEYQAKFPKAKFVFSHDESGQFQTYFSIYKVLKSKSKKKAA